MELGLDLRFLFLCLFPGFFGVICVGSRVRVKI